MRPDRLLLLLLTALVAACARDADILNSDRIEARYGSYGVAIVAQDARSRRSRLYSVDSGVQTVRTFAVVTFVGADSEPIADAHASIVAGGSIGATLRDFGWAVRKSTALIGNIPMPDTNHPIAAAMRLEEPGNLAAHVYDLHAERGDLSVHYARIIEVHHPDYLSLEDLQTLFPPAAGQSLDENAARELASLVLTND